MNRARIHRILLFLALVLSLNFGLDRFYKRSVMFNARVSIQDQQWAGFKGPLDYLVIGDSHAEGGIDPLVLGNCFNYASASESPMLSYYKLKHLLEKGGARPASIFLSLDLHYFTSLRRDMIKGDYYWTQYADYFEMARETGNSAFYLKWFLGTFASYAGNADDLEPFTKGGRAGLRNGFLPRSGKLGTVKNHAGRAKNRARVHYLKRDLCDPVLISYFHRMLGLCDQYGIGVKLVRYPITQAYYDAAMRYFPDKNLQCMDLKALEGHSSVEEILDFQRVYWGMPEMFADTDHLNKFGGKDFTQKLKECL